MERQIGLVAQGKAEKGAVVTHTLLQFAAKFTFFVRNISRMDALFEASFSPLASSGTICLAFQRPFQLPHWCKSVPRGH